MRLGLLLAVLGAWWAWRRTAAARVARRLVSRPALSRGRRPGPVERWLAPRLVAADLDWPAGLVARAVAASAVGVVVVGGASGGPVLSLIGLVVVGGGVALVLSLADGRREARLERELPALLESVARSLRSGAAIPSALREASTTGSAAAADLAGVLAEVDRGLPLGEALAGWTRRRPLPGVRLVVGAVVVALTSGGAPARAVDGVAATLRDRAEVDREVNALATQARASAVVVTLAPLAFGAIAVLGDERTATFLLRTPVGLGCLVSGLALDAVAAHWMTRIARGPTP